MGKRLWAVMAVTALALVGCEVKPLGPAPVAVGPGDTPGNNPATG